MSLASDRRTVFLVVLTVALLAVVPAAATAQESRAGGTVTVAEGETTGDLEVYGGDVVIRGTVDGDLSAFAGNVRILGTVTGDVETAAGNVVVAGSIGGDLSATGGNVALAESGSVGGALEAGAGSVRIDGTVGENATVGAETVTLGSNASIGGDLAYDGTLDRASGAAVGGAVVEDADVGMDGPIPSIPGLVFSVYGLLVNLVVGVLLLLVFPDFTRELADRTGDRPVVTGVAGLGVLVLAPILFVLVALTIVGIPLALVGIVGYVLAIWLGSVYGRYLLGDWLVSLVGAENRWLALLVGFAVVAVLGWLPLVGWLVDLAVVLLGLGALALGLFAGYRRARGRQGQATDTDADSRSGSAAEPTAD